MARPDYKQTRAPQPEKKPSSTVPFLAGLSLGILGSFLTYLWLGKALPQQANNLDKPTVAAPQVVEPKQPEPPKPLAQPSFEFYTMLPKQEPQQQTMPPLLSTPSQEQPTHTPGKAESIRYILQVQAFSSQQAADELRADLILQNFRNVYVESVQVDDKTWYRVNIGPLDSKDNIQSLQGRLQQYQPVLRTIRG